MAPQPRPASSRAPTPLRGGGDPRRPDRKGGVAKARRHGEEALEGPRGEVDHSNPLAAGAARQKDVGVLAVWRHGQVVPGLALVEGGRKCNRAKPRSRGRSQFEPVVVEQ